MRIQPIDLYARRSAQMGIKMKILTAYCTDVGNVKKINQDALLIKTAEYGQQQIVLLCICDGMGGLAMGERASAHVILEFEKWFDSKLLHILEKGQRTVSIREQWVRLLENANAKLKDFGQQRSINLGTTCTAMLIIGEIYYIIHVGDSRVYQITNEIEQITDDQTVLAREIAMGRANQAGEKADARESVLLQCVGASPNIDPQFLEGKVRNNAVYMLCSDGFRHKITSDEFCEGFAPNEMQNEAVMKHKCRFFVELNKTREERDNISVVLAKTNEK